MTLREWLDGRGTKIGFFADEIGVTAQTMSGYLNGYRSPSLTTRILIEQKTGGAVPRDSWPAGDAP